MDGTSLKMEIRLSINFIQVLVFGNNTDAIVLEDSIHANDGSPSYIASEDAGNTIIS